MRLEAVPLKTSAPPRAFRKLFAGTLMTLDPLFSPWRAGKLTLEPFHLRLRILADHMVGGPATLDAKPLLKLRIPPNFHMFHCEIYTMKFSACQ